MRQKISLPEQSPGREFHQQAALLGTFAVTFAVAVTLAFAFTTLTLAFAFAVAVTFAVTLAVLNWGASEKFGRRDRESNSAAGQHLLQEAASAWRNLFKNLFHGLFLLLGHSFSS
jgi:hypothetical protein